MSFTNLSSCRNPSRIQKSFLRWHTSTNLIIVKHSKDCAGVTKWFLSLKWPVHQISPSCVIQTQKCVIYLQDIREITKVIASVRFAKCTMVTYKLNARFVSYEQNQHFSNSYFFYNESTKLVSLGKEETK